MKRIFTIILLMVAMFTVSAQPTPGFWSNWSAGGNITASEQMTFDNANLGQDLNLGLGLRAQKQLSDRWVFRLIAEVPGVFTSDTLPYDRYMQVLVGFQYGNRLYGFADGGAAIRNNQYGWLALNADAGMGYRWFIQEHSTIYTELGVDVTADVRRNLSTSHIFVRVGYIYNFGLTKADKTLREQWDVLQKDNHAALCRYDSIEHAHETCVSREQELLERIATLESYQHEATVIRNADPASAHRLDSIISDIKTNQDYMYALPFSIEFPLNGYHIPADQKYRLKSIAKIMSKDTTMSFTVAGYCDASGSDEYNMKLSGRRAQAVADELIRLGVREEQLTVTGKGKNIAFGDLTDGINRRVSFFRNL